MSEPTYQAQSSPLERVVRLPRVKRGEYWVFVLIDHAGEKVGNTWGGIIGKTMTVPATLAFKGCVAGVFESAAHGIATYRQPNVAHERDDEA